VRDFSPSIVRNNSITYSFLAGNVFFVCLGMDPSASYLESQLQKSEASNADFRIIFHHYPIYSGGDHGASGDSSVEAICDRYNVTMSFAGHDHHYERSEVIYGRSAVYSGRDVPAHVAGTTYVVTGGAGAPLRSVDSKWWTDYATKKYHYCVLTAYSDRLEMTVKDDRGAVLENFVRRIGTPPTSTYALTVNKGTGSGDYDPGDPVTITASPPQAGWRFNTWKVDAGSPSIANANAMSTTLTMPSHAVIVSATYVPNVACGKMLFHEGQAGTATIAVNMFLYLLVALWVLVCGGIRRAWERIDNS